MKRALQWKTSITPFSILSRDERSSFPRKFSFISILFSYTFDYFVLINLSHGWQITEGQIEKENSIWLLSGPGRSKCRELNRGCIAPKAGSLWMKAWCCLGNSVIDHIKETQPGGWGHRAWGHTGGDQEHPIGGCSRTPDDLFILDQYLHPNLRVQALLTSLRRGSS